jgi:hypothetical protein
MRAGRRGTLASLWRVGIFKLAPQLENPRQLEPKMKDLLKILTSKSLSASLQYHLCGVIPIWRNISELGGHGS